MRAHSTHAATMQSCRRRRPELRATLGTLCPSGSLGGRGAKPGPVLSAVLAPTAGSRGHMPCAQMLMTKTDDERNCLSARKTTGGSQDGFGTGGPPRPSRQVLCLAPELLRGRPHSPRPLHPSQAGAVDVCGAAGPGERGSSILTVARLLIAPPHPHTQLRFLAEECEYILQHVSLISQ